MKSDFLSLFTKRKLAVVRDDLAPSSVNAALVTPAQNISADLVNEIISLTGGIPFVALSTSRVFAFGLERMGRPRTSTPALSSERAGLQMCVSVEARSGVTTGISSSDRAKTVAILGEEEPNPRRLVRPGHIVPVETKVGGVLVRAAIPEAAIDLVRITGFTEAALFIDLLGPSGESITQEELEQLTLKHAIPQVTISELLEYRLSTETIIERVAEAKLPTTAAGELRAIIYRSKLHYGEHLALVKGDLDISKPILTRVQAERTLTDVFGGPDSKTRRQIHAALKLIGERGSGV